MQGFLRHWVTSTRTVPVLFTIHNSPGYCLLSASSSSSGAVFFEKAGCHDPPWLPILNKSLEVFVSHSRPFCDVCHPLRSWPSSASFPLQWTLQQQPVYVVTSDHVTKVVNFSFLYCWYYVKLFVCQCYDFFICFLFPPGYFHHLPICPHFKRLQFCHISGGDCPRFTSV